MRNVRFTPEVIKELRKLVRDAGQGHKLQTALQKIYTTGFDNGQADATKRIKEVLDANQQILNSSDDNDGVVIQPAGSEHGEREGLDAADTYSGYGSIEAFTESLPEYDESDTGLI